MPWDQSTAFGYWAEFFYSAASGVAYLIVFYSMSLIFIGIVLHFGAFYKVYDHWFSQLGASKDNQRDSQLLFKLIEFNIMAKKYVTQYCRIIRNPRNSQSFYRINNFRLFAKTCDMFFIIGTIQLLHGLVLLAVFLFKTVEVGIFLHILFQSANRISIS